MFSLISKLSSTLLHTPRVDACGHIALPEEPRTVALPPELIPLALTSPSAAHRILVDAARKQHGSAVEFGRNVRLRYPLEPLLEIPHDTIWSGYPGAIIKDSTEELISALKGLSHDDIFNRHYGPVDPANFDMAGYLKCTRVRVLRLFQALRDIGITNGRLLEVGSLYGSFALILQRLGFQVTAVDRYGSYGAGFGPAVDLMRTAGVQIISTTRENETEIISALGQYDSVIAMAVIEHIPHTPRPFLEQLVRHVRPGGCIALDTPNLVRYWNRIRFERGESIFMDIKSQYYADLPYEGHHREYTGAELKWMLERCGCENTDVDYFDYNLFQFEHVDKPHIECLIQILQDPTCADTILVRGQIPMGQP